MKKIIIGTQTWMAENLNIDKFLNGDFIPQAKTNDEWIKVSTKSQPAWCYYNNTGFNGEKYGKLYNWYAVNDPRGLAPKGWHIPCINEWVLLEEYCGESEVGKILRSSRGWELNKNGTDEVGFSGLPGGLRVAGGEFHDIGYGAYFWSSTESTTKMYKDKIITFTLENYREATHSNKWLGLSVRCIKD